jgi:adenine/guanine phosphoribosyltransferase-like PRPP-binding protein
VTTVTGIKAAQHMEGYLSPEIRAKRIKGALAVIKHHEKQGEVFDAIAYRGASGAITASIIAHHLKKPLILVRKPEDTRGHSPYMVEGPTVVKRYLIVDDFMSTGATYEAIREAVRKEHPQAELLRRW